MAAPTEIYAAPSLNGARLKRPTPLDMPQRRALAKVAPQGNQYTDSDRLFRDYRTPGTLYAVPDLDLRLIRTMLSEDGNPAKLEQVLTLPIRGAGKEIRGKGPEADLAREVLGPLIDRIVAQCTSAFAYKKAFFELDWTLDEQGRAVYNDVLMRPAVSCEAAFDERSGESLGFRQRLAPTSLFQITTTDFGWVPIEAERSFIYTYGTHREPLMGMSDFAVCLRNWQIIDKIEFLWGQYLEGQSLPKLAVFGNSLDEARKDGQAIAGAAASGIVPMVWPDVPDRKVIEVIESSGKGADQFSHAINHFASKQTSSVLASFTDLAQHASVGGRGSNALSADQSEFFLAASQGKADEIAHQITEGLIKPLIVYNFGSDAKIPKLYIGPIGNRQVDRALDLLKSIMSSQHPTAPPKFVASLMSHTAAFLGLEEDDIETMAQEWAERQEEQAAYATQLDQTMRLQQAALGGGPGGDQGGPAGPGGGSGGGGGAPYLPPLPPGLDGAGAGPGAAGGQQGAIPAPRRANMAADQPSAALEQAKAEPEHTGGMIALLPDAASVKKLAITGHKSAEQPDALHLTLAYLGDDVTDWPATVRDQLTADVRRSATGGPVKARAMGSATFNADGGPNNDRDPCAVYLVGDSDRIAPLRSATLAAVNDRVSVPLQHEPFLPHVTAGYGMTSADLDYTGDVTFDRIGVFFGDQRTEIPLTP